MPRSTEIEELYGVLIEEVYADPADARYPSIDAAFEAAIPHLLKLIGPVRLDENSQVEFEGDQAA